MKAYIVKNKKGEYLTHWDQCIEFDPNPYPSFIEFFISKEEAIEFVYPEIRDQVDILEVDIP